MNRSPVIVTTLAAVLLALVISGCNENESSPAAIEEPITFEIDLDFNVDGQPLIPNQMNYTNPDGRAYSIGELRFVISNVTVYSVEGDSIQLKDIHYFEMLDPSSYGFHLSSDFPHAEWNRISFTFGLDATHNVRDEYINMTKFQSEMALPTSMGPDLGYHYMQITGNYVAAPGDTSSYVVHTGARHLDGSNLDFPGVVDATPYHHYFTVDLPLTPTHIHDGGTGTVTIDFDLNGWYVDHAPADGTDTQYDFADYPGTIMGNLEAQDRLQANGPFCFSATLTSSGGHHEH